MDSPENLANKVDHSTHHYSCNMLGLPNEPKQFETSHCGNELINTANTSFTNCAQTFNFCKVALLIE